MIQLKKTQIERAIITLVEAFAEDQAHAYFFPDKATRKKKLEHLYRFKLRTQRHLCWVSSDHVEAIAIWEPPGAHVSTLTWRDILYGIPLLFHCGISDIRRLIAYQELCAKLRLKLIQDPYWYLDILAVAPEHQNKGMGHKLTEPFVQQASAADARCYLETMDPRNSKYYEDKFGFHVVHRSTISGYPLEHHCLIR
jgi:ribosomal protein S18 acetylase RimI-like enzyme